jgi:hypothetical protein
MSMMGELARTDDYSPEGDLTPLDTLKRYASAPRRAIEGAIGSVLTLPQRAFQASEQMRTEGPYDPAPAVEAALLPMGTGAVAGVKAAPGEAVLGAGPIRAYHSSPHDFDRFDLSKIGTGEGAQVYGHGLYFAENPAVSGQGGQYWDQFRGRFDIPERNAALTLKLNKFDRDAAIAEAQAKLEAEQKRYGALSEGLRDNPKLRGAPTNATINDRMRELELLQSGKPVGPRTYEVNINADPAHMLDWDNKLPMNSPARAKLYELGEKGMKYHEGGIDRQFAKDSILSAQNELLTGEGALRMMGKAVDQARPIMKAEGDPYALFGSLPAMSSRMLNEAGIPGIKYLDEGSRGRQVSNKNALWQDPLTHNYVIFDPSIIDITRKYAVPGALGAGGMGALAAQDQYQGE